jgi:acyl-[acyl-carrier-protein]-phospholipid O-acyltransferase/long-chain-fatty-acid--[acyl-carrier-protein] ligase
MTLQRHFVHIAKRFAGKPAFIDCTTNRTITYSRALTGALLLAGVFGRFEKGFTGVMVPTSAGCALSVLGLLMSGRTPVMINYSTGVGENVSYARRKCGFTTTITSRALLEKLRCRPMDGMVFLEDIMENISGPKKLKAALASRLPARVIETLIHGSDADENAAILFTSGSEKEPKAVQLTHRGIISNIEGLSERYALSESDSFLANLPYFHVFGLTANLWTPLYHGMTAISYASPIEYRSICEVMRRERPTLMVGTPSFYQGYLRKSEHGDFKSLRLAISGADKCPDSLREGFMKKHGITLYEAYGTTETSPGISGNAPGMNRPGSVGRPFKGVSVAIDSCETGDRCAPGQMGRILVKGDMLMNGYFDDIEETAMRMRHGWYDTGDMGYLDEDGYLWHTGRLRRFVKIGGEMVSLVRVENVLEGLLPEDVGCCVVEVPDPVKGARIVAVVTDEVDSRKTLKKMSRDLPKIALPDGFVVMDELPKMGSGKIDFRTITDMVRESRSL